MSSYPALEGMTMRQEELPGGAWQRITIDGVPGRHFTFCILESPATFQENLNVWLAEVNAEVEARNR